MKIAFLDESGHSHREPFTIVAGIVIDPDRQWHDISARLDSLRERVPIEFRKYFIFHASDLEFGGKYRERWPANERHSILGEILEIPREFGAVLVMGLFKKTENLEARKSWDQKQKLDNSLTTHAVAYFLCMKAIDSFLKRHCAEREYAMVVAEQRREAHSTILGVHRLVRSQELISRWVPDFAQEELPAIRLKVTPAFAAKQDEPLLQIADACAFALQRHLNNSYRSEELIESLFGSTSHPTFLSEIKRGNPPWLFFGWK
jgi:hypothetical protein